jgi:phosphate transport system permease protein
MISLAQRHAAERRFRSYGLLAVSLTGLFLAFLVANIVKNALPAFTAHEAVVKIKIDPANTDYGAQVKDAWRAQFPDVASHGDKKKLTGLLSTDAPNELQAFVASHPQLAGTEAEVPLLLSANADLYFKGHQTDGKEAGWLDALQTRGVIHSGFAWNFLTQGDSREPELSGIRGALIGSLLTIAVTLLLSLPLGVAAALYLEEFAPKSRFTDLIEVNINNLAAVPSIIFGLLGLAVFLNIFGLPRSAPLVGGLVLALLVLPTIIIASRAAIRSVPPSIKEAALGVGASHQQAVFHHVLPLALPGILTGTILGVARALGETAPLLMIGMVAFIADIPHGFTDAATVLPVQIYLWSDLPEAAFVSRTSAAIVVLLLVLFLFNALAIVLRRKFERRW